MKTKILYRKPDMSDEELQSAQKYFSCTSSRVISDSLVIARYATWPYYHELYHDLKLQGSRLINTPKQYDFITDVKSWSCLLDKTPRTWDRLEDVPDVPVILKGKWKSRKDKWSTHMYASNKKEAIEVYCRLLDDTLIGQDTIYIREYIPLKTFMIGLNGLPITEEYRFFVLDQKVICGGFYWSNYWDDLDHHDIDIKKVPDYFLQDVIDQVGNGSRFYTIDVSSTQKGDWIVVELNEGQQSGLPVMDPDCLYDGMKSHLNGF
jgi:hypothetical protein